MPLHVIVRMEWAKCQGMWHIAAKSGSSWLADKKTGISVLQIQGNKFCQYECASRKELNQAGSMTSTFWYEQGTQLCRFRHLIYRTELWANEWTLFKKMNVENCYKAIEN